MIMEAGNTKNSALMAKKAPTMPKPQWHPPWKLYRVSGSALPFTSEHIKGFPSARSEIGNLGSDLRDMGLGTMLRRWEQFPCAAACWLVLFLNTMQFKVLVDGTKCGEWIIKKEKHFLW